ncbi:2507_t:CDS:2 [Diversispora eburnea]|uniref:2507_t:CDS:1 n=1 Tax=Diversispora eburnea TaxID=1213867 RepID=A0A9N8WMJ5_9GLOM|nr:2507_t:CDS:2 [Diversispora eburnea]
MDAKVWLITTGFIRSFISAYSNDKDEDDNYASKLHSVYRTHLHEEEGGLYSSGSLLDQTNVIRETSNGAVTSRSSLT